jgi:hypothetical protein
MIFARFSSKILKIGNEGQSYIIQFVIFFLIGIGLFVGIGNFFLIQYELIRKDTANISIEMINGYLSSLVVASVDSCLQCGSVENRVRMSDTTAGYFLEVTLNQSGLVVSTAPPEKGYISKINNLAYSFASIDGSAPSIQPINLTYDRNQNKLEVR